MAASRFLVVCSASLSGFVPNNGDDRINSASGRRSRDGAKPGVEFRQAADLHHFDLDAHGAGDRLDALELR